MMKNYSAKTLFVCPDCGKVWQYGYRVIEHYTHIPTYGKPRKSCGCQLAEKSEESAEK